MRLAAALEAGRRDFLDAVRGITPEQAVFRPDENGWSVVECVEHVVTFEARYLEWIANATPLPTQGNSERELRLFTMIRNRLTKVKAPAVMRPQGRFRSLPEAVAEFERIRSRTIQFIEERGDGLYSLATKHPYFGTVNGAELMQLIDGHARRHADQIRETCEAFVTRHGERSKIDVRPRRAKNPPEFKRDEPDLPADFESDDGSGQLDGGQSVTIEDRRLHDLERPRLNIGDFSLKGCVLERVQLAGGQFGSAVWKDVRFVGCDLANIRVHRMALVRVEFVDCRLTGFSAAALNWQDVLIRNGDVRYAQLQNGTFRNCEWKDSNWEDADLRNSDFTGCLCRSCKLARADFRETKLQNTDFRGSEVEGMIVGMHDLRAAIVSPDQAMIFARVLGLQIR